MTKHGMSGLKPVLVHGVTLIVVLGLLAMPVGSATARRAEVDTPPPTIQTTSEMTAVGPPWNVLAFEAMSDSAAITPEPAQMAQTNIPDDVLIAELLAPTIALAASASPSITWWITTVAEPVYDCYPSLALDSNAQPHISYRDGSDDAVKHTWRGESGWIIETVDSETMYGGTWIDLDANDYPHITYGKNGGLQYAYYDGATWHSFSVYEDLYYYSSLELDSQSLPHIAYLVGDGDPVMYAHFDGTDWTTEHVGGNTACVGCTLCLVLDDEDHPHISSTTSGSGSALWYYYHDGTDWKSFGGPGGSGQYSSLQLDSEGYPHISFYQWLQDALIYTFYDGSLWQYQTVEDTGDVGRYTSLVMDSMENLHLSYYDVANRDLKYAFFNGVTWQTEIVDDDVVVGPLTSMALDALGNRHIAYADAVNDNLKYAVGIVAPTLYAIDNMDGDGDYLVNWSDVIYSISYTLEVDTTPDFSSPQVAYEGATSQLQVTQQEGGAWYYRVVALTPGGRTAWSQIQAVTVAPDAPDLFPIANDDWDNDYLVNWRSVQGATSYVLQEDNNGAFTSPATVYQGAASELQVTGHVGGLWYYRVRASNGAGDSPWSNTEAVGMRPLSAILYLVSNPDLDGNYWVEWADTEGADSYQLEEDNNQDFTTPVVIYEGSDHRYRVVEQENGDWYYRLRASNEWGYSPWSEPQDAHVGPWPSIRLPIVVRNYFHDPYEPNDTFADAWGPLVSGVTYHAHFPTESDEDDYYYFDMPATHRVEMWLTDILPGNDHALYLYDAAHVFVDFSDNYGAEDEHIVQISLLAGRYYVRVERFQGTTQTQPYALRVVFED